MYSPFILATLSLLQSSALGLPRSYAPYHQYNDSPHAPPLTVLASSRAVVSGRLTEATLVVNKTTGKITSVFDSVLSPSDFPNGTLFVDYSPKLLLPGLVDTHVHLNEPGRTEWEGFHTGTRAAASGGVTTLIDMPLNALPPTTTVENLNTKVKAAEGQCWVDVGFHGGIIPGNENDLKPLVQAGVRGFKGFLIDSGVSPTSQPSHPSRSANRHAPTQIDEFPAIGTAEIEKALLELAGEPTTVMFHAEMVPPNVTLAGENGVPIPGPRTNYQTYLDTRPPSLETYAIEEILSLAHVAPDLDLHIVHLSAQEGIPILQEARARGVKITAETCFHYLSLAAEGVAEGDTRYKCSPPTREQENQDGLWRELQRKGGVIHSVVSDHSPCTPDLKLLPQSMPVQPHGVKGQEGDFFSAWGGISGLGLGLSIMWTEGEKKGLTIEDIVRLTSKNTAEQVGLDAKGDIAVGYDADVVVFDDEATFVVGPSTMQFRHKVSPYETKTLKGVVAETWLRGEKIYTRSEGLIQKQPAGKLLLEPRKA
ncbi:Amidohydrolase 1 [Macrophomina phaseolina MS6]|uniref:allantoinase n=1 Tax=Macrophomina phaseolina (strain MS6) TaxID=1126212 RepID=K2S4T9_MACPH|nr:Amidohydrolase 1 [Macrophomina phaseolina MS6]